MKLFPYILISLVFGLLVAPVLAEPGEMATQLINADTPLPRSWHATLAFDNKMWVIGGSDSRGDLHNDVWFSTDGITWTCTNHSAGFPKTYDLRALVFNDTLWVFAASSDNGWKDEIWSSKDGIIWDLATGTPEFPYRYDFSVLAFDNRMWVIGGDGSRGWKSDVWYSSDGINWSAANLSAAFPGRSGHSSFVFDNRMWVVGGG